MFGYFLRYWDTVLEMSWPRFTYVVELNVDSVRNTDPQKLGVIDIRPHYVSMDFIWLFSSLASSINMFLKLGLFFRTHSIIASRVVSIKLTISFILETHVHIVYLFLLLLTQRVQESTTMVMFKHMEILTVNVLKIWP